MTVRLVWPAFTFDYFCKATSSDKKGISNVDISFRAHYMIEAVCKNCPKSDNQNIETICVWTMFACACVGIDMYMYIYMYTLSSYIIHDYHWAPQWINGEKKY